LQYFQFLDTVIPEVFGKWKLKRCVFGVELDSF